MPKIPVILPEIAPPPVFQRKSGYRTVNLRVPGPWDRQFVPDDMTMPAEFTAENPNRLGAEIVPVRLYEPELERSQLHQINNEPVATIVWAHGGSFVRGDLDAPDSHWFAGEMASRNVRVISVDYSLISETLKAPAPANEMGAVLRWVEAHYGGLIAVGGASAGANLAAQAALLQAVDASAGVAAHIHGLILLYPTMHRQQQERADITDLTAEIPEDKRFSAAYITQMYDYYLGDIGTCSATNRAMETVAEAESMQAAQSTAAAGGERASLAAITALIEQIKSSEESSAASDGSLRYPHYSERPMVIGELRTRHLARLPRTFVINAELDDLRASGEQFAEQLKDARVPVATHTVPRATHGFMNPNISRDCAMHAVNTIEIIVEKLREWKESDGI